MIIDSLYPTITSESVTAFSYEVTDYVYTLGNGYENYWLGWMYFDNIPTIYKSSDISLNNGVLTAIPNNIVKNSPVGFGADNYGYDEFQEGYIKETGWIFGGSVQNYLKYLNSVYTRSIATTVKTSTGSNGETIIKYALETGSDENLGTYTAPQNITMSAAGLNTVARIVGFYTGEITAEFSITIGGEAVSFSLDSTIFEDTGTVELSGISGGTHYKITFFLPGFGVAPNTCSPPPPEYQTRRFHILPILKMYTENGNYFCFFAGSQYVNNSIDVYTQDNIFYIRGYNIGDIGVLGGYDFSVSFDNDLTDNNYTRVNRVFYTGNCAVWHVGGTWNNYRIFRIYKPSEIIAYFALQMRLTDNNYNVFGYHTGVYIPEVLDTGEFTGKLLTGELQESDVQPWQWDNINIDDFTENDIPEYVPPTPEEAENIGDKITRPASIGVGGTNGFVTQYALNRADVAQLGALLWTSFVDQDYWQNYLFSLALDTGTFQLSGLLNFFVSLKVYPFPLINIDSFSQWGSDMYIGTGIVPLHFNNPLHVINNYCDYISGGYIEIPRYFNDYRDYINTEISLYLPFCGTVQLNPGDVIGNRIEIEYAIDFATGGCIAYVDLTTGDGAGYPVGALPGQIGADIPLTATAAGEVAARFIGDGLNVAGMIGGEVGRIGSGVAGALGGNPSGGSGGGSVFAGVAGMYGGAGAAMAADLAPGLARQGLQVLQRGAVGAPMLSGGRGFAAFGAPSKPYVQIRRGIYPELTGLHTVDGAPAAATATISSLSGFIQGSVKADGLSCHQAEKEEIIALIASGIYV